MGYKIVGATPDVLLVIVICANRHFPNQKGVESNISEYYYRFIGGN